MRGWQPWRPGCRTTRAELNDTERAFVEASLGERERLAQEREEQRRSKADNLTVEQKSASRFRRLTIMAVGLFIIAVIAAGLAVRSAGQADPECGPGPNQASGCRRGRSVKSLSLARRPRPPRPKRSTSEPVYAARADHLGGTNPSYVLDERSRVSLAPGLQVAAGRPAGKAVGPSAGDVRTRPATPDLVHALPNARFYAAMRVRSGRWPTARMETATGHGQPATGRPGCGIVAHGRGNALLLSGQVNVRSGRWPTARTGGNWPRGAMTGRPGCGIVAHGRGNALLLSGQAGEVWSVAYSPDGNGNWPRAARMGRPGCGIWRRPRKAAAPARP